MRKSRRQLIASLVLASVLVVGCSTSASMVPPERLSAPAGAIVTHSDLSKLTYQGHRYAVMAVSAPHFISPILASDFITLKGYTGVNSVKVDLLRPDLNTGTLIQISTATGVPDANGDLNILHPPPLKTTLTTTCFTGFSPTLQMGDVVQVTTDAGLVENTTVMNMSCHPVEQVDASTVAVHGNARDAGGNPLPLAQIEARLVLLNKASFFANNRTTLRAAGFKPIDGSIAYDANPATPGDYTAIFPGLSPTDMTKILSGVGLQTWSMWLGVAVPPTEQTVFQTPALPVIGCAAPFANAVTAAVPSVINVANITAPLTLKGTADPDVTAVAVGLNGAPVHVLALAPSTGQKNWTVSIPAAEVAALPDGALTATASFTSPAGVTAGQSLTITKATVPATASATPPGGAFNTPQSVVLTANTPGSKIFYTTDGTTPSPSSTLYTGTPIPITTTTFLRYFVVDPSGNSSPVTMQIYIFVPITVNVAASPKGGTFGTTQNVALTSSDAAARIFYTLDGSTPTSTSNLYTGTPIPLATTTLLKYVAINAIGLQSAIGIQTYTIVPGLPVPPPPVVQPPVVQPPVVTPPGVTPPVVGFRPTPAPFVTPSAAGSTVLTLLAGRTVNIIVNNVVGSKVFYTVNGSTPTTASTLETSPITLPKGAVTLKFFAVSPAGAQSAVQTKFYKQL